MKTRPVIATTAAIAVTFMLAWDAGHADTTELLSKCTICHGENGVSVEPAYPTIAGIPVEVQVDAMRGYRDGKRDCGPVSRMCKITEPLTDEEILYLSEYFAAFEFVPAEQDFDPDLAAEGAFLHEDFCEVCHGDSPEDSDRSILHGQWKDYLVYSLNQYRIGARKQPPSMRRQTEKLSERDIQALVNFYASYSEDNDWQSDR
jgi:sulfide dehydrogenase cytochrome subunit